MFWCSFALLCTTSKASEAPLRGSRNLGIGLESTEAPVIEDSAEAPVVEDGPIGDLGAVGVSDPDLSILIQLIMFAGVGNLLATPGALTVFAPTNAAWAESMIDVENLETVDVLDVMQILSYHVVPGFWMSSNLTDGLMLPTLQSEFIEFNVTDAGILVNEEVISTADIVATNGIVHKIDGVLFPEAVL